MKSSLLNTFFAALILASFAICSVAYAEVTPEEEFIRDTKDFNYSQTDTAILLAKKYIKLERIDLAEQILDKTLETKPSDYTFYIFYGDLLSRLLKTSKAIDVLEVCRDKKIVSFDVEMMLGDLYFRTQNYAKASRCYEKAASINKIFVEPLFYWGISSAFLGLESDPIKAFKAIESQFPSNPYSTIGWGIYHYYRGDFEAAVVEMNKIRTQEDLPAIFFLTSCALNIQLGKFADAESDLQKAINADPLYEGILTNTAILALYTKKQPDIIKALETAEKHEKFAEMKLAKAYFLIKANREGEAETILKAILNDSPKSYYANYLLGAIYASRVDKDLADTAGKKFEELMAIIKPNADQAVSYLRACVTNGKDFFAGYFLLGKIYFSRREYKEALEEFNKAAKLSPRNISVQKFIGHCYLSLSRWSEAKRTFEALLQRNEKDAHVIDCIAYITAVTGNLSEAIKMFETALAIDKNDKYARDSIKLLQELEKKMRSAK